MDPLAWVCEQGVVLQSARGPVPNLAREIAGEPIRGSWWGHPSGREIFAVLNRLRASGDVVATHLIEGKVTLVHRRIWPALIRVADRFTAERLAALDEQHTASGAHRTIEVSFPNWVPPEDIAAAALLRVDEHSSSFQSACADADAYGRQEARDARAPAAPHAAAAIRGTRHNSGYGGCISTCRRRAAHGSQEHAMPRLMEHARRHGPFDPRFRLRHSMPEVVVATAGHPEIAGWEDDGGALSEPRDAKQPRVWS